MSRRIKVAVVTVGAVLVWIGVSPFIAQWLIVERHVKRADAIVVLSGSAAYRERCRRAAELYRENTAPVIYLSNDGLRAGWSNSEQRNPYFVELAQRELIGHGVMPDAIRVLDGYVAGTDDEAAALTREVDARQLNSVILVTSPYHTRRTLYAFTSSLTGRKVDLGIAHTSVADLRRWPSLWWTSVKSIREVASEYVKLAAYWTFS